MVLTCLLALLLHLLWSLMVSWVVLHVFGSLEAFCRMSLTWGWSGISR